MTDDAEFERWYRALQSRDARFDGWFFTAVTSTRIYCRPSCPARTPAPEHVRFYPTAAAAQQAGFRACLRCRPDAVPGSPEWVGRADVAARAMRLILDGAVDRVGVAGLARGLGYSERQLHRVLIAEVGTGALALARAQRAQTARTLLETTEMTAAAIAFAAGFASVRQFNDTIRAIFARTPSELRHRARRRPQTSAAGGPAAPAVTLRLSHRSPLAVAPLMAFLGARALSGLEELDSDCYRRALALPHGLGTVLVRPGGGHLLATFQLADLRDLTAAVTRCRHLFNLDADPVAVDATLGDDEILGPLVRATPGLRVPGAVDGFEIAVRAVLGQQVSRARARLLGRSLVELAGESLPQPLAGVTRAFPTAERLAEMLGTSCDVLGMPSARRHALLALSEAVASGRLRIDPGAARDELRQRLGSLAGAGSWTAGYVAMRALGDPDAFLAGDGALRRAAARLGLPAGRSEFEAAAERWRPWRAYAQMHLWSAAASPRKEEAA